LSGPGVGLFLPPLLRGLPAPSARPVFFTEGLGARVPRRGRRGSVLLWSGDSWPGLAPICGRLPCGLGRGGPGRFNFVRGGAPVAYRGGAGWWPVSARFWGGGCSVGPGLWGGGFVGFRRVVGWLPGGCRVVGWAGAVGGFWGGGWGLGLCVWGWGCGGWGWGGGWVGPALSSLKAPPGNLVEDFSARRPLHVACLPAISPGQGPGVNLRGSLRRCVSPPMFLFSLIPFEASSDGKARPMPTPENCCSPFKFAIGRWRRRPIFLRPRSFSRETGAPALSSGLLPLSIHPSFLKCGCEEPLIFPSRLR